LAGLKDLKDGDEVPEDPPEPEPAPEVHLLSSGPVGSRSRLIPDVPPHRQDDFHGPAMQPYILPSTPIMGIMPPYLLDFHKVKFDLKHKAGSRSERVCDFL